MSNNLKFVGIEYSQISYVKKNLLYSEMELLIAMKKLQTFKKLRVQEFAAKNLYKKLISQIKLEFLKLYDYLPLSELGKESLKISSSQKSRDSLEREIDEIRAKISELQ